MTAEIHDHGQAWNRKKVARLMAVAGIEGIHRGRLGCPDMVKRKFVAEHPNQLWVAGISYDESAEIRQIKREGRRGAPGD